MLQARHAILQAVPGKLDDIDAFDSPSIRLPLAFHSSSTRLALASLTLVPRKDRFLWDRRLPVTLISPSVLIVASLEISTEG